ncbi:MAG: phytoene/squalene synthase family protein [Trueperaceae bacterium]
MTSTSRRSAPTSAADRRPSSSMAPSEVRVAPREDDPRLDAALRHCARVTRDHSKTFALGAGLFPRRQRAAVTAVYAVCRAGDDAVDEAPSSDVAAARLDAWWAGVRNVYGGTPDLSDPLQCALAWTIDRFDVPVSAFEALAVGLRSDQRMDAEPGTAQMRTVDDLLLYCHRVGGVIGAMIVPIAGHRDPERAMPDALALGQAMQLTNVLRDVGEDLQRRGRCYLPLDLMEHYGVDRDALRRGVVDERYVALLDHLSRIADDLYDAGWRSVPGLHGRTAYAVGLAAHAYQAIAGELRRNGHDNLGKRAHLSAASRLARVPPTLIRVQRGRLRRRCPIAPSTGGAGGRS